MKLIVGLKLRVVFSNYYQTNTKYQYFYQVDIISKSWLRFVCIHIYKRKLLMEPSTFIKKSIGPLCKDYKPSLTYFHTFRKLNERQLSHWPLFWSNAVSHEFISLKMSHLSQIDTVSTVSLIFSQLCTPSQPHPLLPQLLTIKPPIHVHLSTGDQTRGSLSKPQKCKVSTTLWTYEKY